MSLSTTSSGIWCTSSWGKTMSSRAGAADFGLSCPVSFGKTDEVLLGHGSGGKMTADLIACCFLPAFRNQYLEKLDDQAVLRLNDARLAFTTDGYVVTPLFFPGGDIGVLAVHGTVNGLAMAGARPLYLSAAFILEEGGFRSRSWSASLAPCRPQPRRSASFW